MKDSIVFRVLINIYGKLAFYCRYSSFCRVLGRLGESFRKAAASSCILGFFDREWKIESAWTGSFIFKLFIQPLRLFKYGSDRLSDWTVDVLEGSIVLNAARALMSSLFTMSTRVYGLLLLTFAAVRGMLELIFGNSEALFGTRGIIELALFLAGAALILINRPPKGLLEGSILGRMAYDFFFVRGLEDGTDKKE